MPHYRRGDRLRVVAASCGPSRENPARQKKKKTKAQASLPFWRANRFYPADIQRGRILELGGPPPPTVPRLGNIAKGHSHRALLAGNSARKLTPGLQTAPAMLLGAKVELLDGEVRQWVSSARGRCTLFAFERSA